MLPLLKAIVGKTFVVNWKSAKTAKILSRVAFVVYSISFWTTVASKKAKNNCDRILENGSKSHMKSFVFLHIFNSISTYAYVFPEYLLYNFDNLSIKFHVMI